MADKKYFQPQSTAQTIQDFYGGKNLFQTPLFYHTTNGIWFKSDSDDGTVTLNGTATDDTYWYGHSFHLGKYINKNTKFTISSGSSNNQVAFVVIVISMDGSTIKYESSGGTETTFELNPSTFKNILFRIHINNGATLSNVVLKPMMRLADGASDEFTIYTPSTAMIHDKMANIPNGVVKRIIPDDIFYDKIYAGDFDGIRPGDVIMGPVSERFYYVAHRDYFYGYNTIGLKSTHHLIIIPAHGLATGRMNETNTTEGGYYNSAGKALVDKLIQESVIPDFGDHVKQFKNLLSNSVDMSTGKINGWSWYDTYGDLMSEVNVYGTTAFSTTPSNIGIQKEQFEIFRDLGTHILIQDIWLRDIAGTTHFSQVSSHGYAYSDTASNGVGLYTLQPFFVLSI